MVDDERFSEYLSRALAHYEQITVDDDAYGVLYYRQLTEEGVTYIHTPVCGYYAQDEKTMVRLFQKLAEKVCTDGTYEFSVELYAHDSECIRTFHTNH